MPTLARCLGHDLGRVEGPSPDSDRILRAPAMECREDLALPFLGTGPPGACCWSPTGPRVEVAVHVFTLTKLFVISAYPSSGIAAGFVAAIASAPPFLNCAPLGAGCVFAVTGTLPSSCHAPLGASFCKPPVEKAGPLVPARIHDGTVVYRPLPTGGGAPAWTPSDVADEPSRSVYVSCDHCCCSPLGTRVGASFPVRNHAGVVVCYSRPTGGRNVLRSHAGVVVCCPRPTGGRNAHRPPSAARGAGFSVCLSGCPSSPLLGLSLIHI